LPAIVLVDVQYLVSRYKAGVKCLGKWKIEQLWIRRRRKHWNQDVTFRRQWQCRDSVL